MPLIFRSHFGSRLCLPPNLPIQIMVLLPCAHAPFALPPELEHTIPVARALLEQISPDNFSFRLGCFERSAARNLPVLGHASKPTSQSTAGVRQPLRSPGLGV
jgi:hypothetical protein